MKSFIFAALCLVTVQAFACSPARPTVAQTSNLQIVLASAAYQAELAAQVDQSRSIYIKNISFEQGIDITLSNDCTIETDLLFKPIYVPGMCPQIDQVIAKTVCL